jgi:hypothetical protein
VKPARGAFGSRARRESGDTPAAFRVAATPISDPEIDAALGQELLCIATQENFT